VGGEARLSVQTTGLSLQDSPPIAIPLTFFLTAPLALAAAGGLVVWNGADVLATRWSPLTLALTHLGTLGFLTMVMLGATYQMVAVVVGSPVPWPRLAQAVHGLFSLGVVLFCWGVAGSNSTAVFIAIIPLTVSVLVFLVPVGIALGRTRTQNVTSIGMRLALLSFFFAAVLGIWMAHGFGGMRFPGSRMLWSQVHLSVALLGWVGGLIVAVSWQVLPMFYLARRIPTAHSWTVQLLAALGALLPVFVLVLAYSLPSAPEAETSTVNLAAGAALPGIVAVWFLHPAVCLRNLAGRKRKRADGSLRFWQLGLGTAPLVGAAAFAAYFWADPKWDLLFGWLALFGWAGAIVHGMLTRIVPFLVWLHRFAPRIGEIRVPSVKKILPDPLVQRNFALHAITLCLGVAAILSGVDWLARSTGVSMALTALALAHLLVHVARQGPERRGLMSGPPAA
jgi:hypothetical protein